MIKDQLLLCERDNTDLRIEVADLKSANGLLHGLIENRDAEVDQLKADRIKMALAYDQLRLRIDALGNEREALRNALEGAQFGFGYGSSATPQQQQDALEAIERALRWGRL